MTERIETKGQVADAVKGNWVDHWAPEPTRPYLRLSRADRPVGTWLLLLPCWWGLALAAAHGGEVSGLTFWIALGCAIGAFLMRGAGCTWNDITDREIDGSVARTRSRPIPSGQVTVKQALGWAVIQSLIAFGILLTFNGTAIALGVLSLLPVAVYPFAKRFTWWPQVFLGIAFNWGALLAWAAQDGGLHPAAVLLYLSGIAWTLYYDTIYAYQDIEDDALIGVKSTARLFDSRPIPWLISFAAATVVLMAGAVIWALGSDPRLWIALAAPVGLGAHLLWQLRRFDRTDPAACMVLFRSNRDAGLIAAMFLAAAALL
ncbi:4-hydroxybenzoate octaprenyltransferase [Palleronia caenipelagi]|uniref:4-hydroxybenzoate octaprenyltransferase n=1 Tax=Palleronia caenipelagi TaxID=2489174 RepID=A0A547Q8R4_9RHOB|nr:4-hydroxybenzoate octaprenyltransferase [Palleronia caenipelagi]TRD22753.1 4-hydroxybenzoate octaprenyltransferase [Palleronia caenipelagi]